MKPARNPATAGTTSSATNTVRDSTKNSTTTATISPESNTVPADSTSLSPRALIFRRIVEEVCTITGSDAAARLIDGERLRVGDEVYTFMHDEHYHPAAMFVYADLGCPPAGEMALRDLLKMNFDLLAGTRGTLSINPDNGNLFYAVRYHLGLASSGERLLESLTLTIEEIRQVMAEGQWLPPGLDAAEMKEVDCRIAPVSPHRRNPLN